MKPRFLVIEKNGDVYTNHRYRVKTACRGSNNTCTVKLGSNFFPASEIIFNETQCTASEELLTSDMHIEVKNITANMSAVEEHQLKGPFKFSPSFTENTFSVLSCDLTFDKKEMSKMEFSRQNNDNEKEDDNYTNNARKTIQRLGLLIFGLCLYVAS